MSWRALTPRLPPYTPLRPISRRQCPDFLIYLERLPTRGSHQDLIIGLARTPLRRKTERTIIFEHEGMAPEVLITD